MNSTVYRSREKKEASNQVSCVASLGTLCSSESSNTCKKSKKVRKSGYSFRHELELKRTHQHEHGVEDLFLYELQHIMHSNKAMSSIVFLCQSPSAQIQIYTFKTKPALTSFGKQIWFPFPLQLWPAIQRVPHADCHIQCRVIGLLPAFWEKEEDAAIKYWSFRNWVLKWTEDELEIPLHTL